MIAPAQSQYSFSINIDIIKYFGHEDKRKFVMDYLSPPPNI